MKYLLELLLLKYIGNSKDSIGISISIWLDDIYQAIEEILNYLGFYDQ